MPSERPMLNLDFCQQCYMQNGYDADVLAVSWLNGWFWCPFGKRGSMLRGQYMRPTDNPPNSCRYALEQVLIQDEKEPAMATNTG